MKRGWKTGGDVLWSVDQMEGGWVDWADVADEVEARPGCDNKRSNLYLEAPWSTSVYT